MAKFNFYVGMGLLGCHKEATVEIPDEDLEYEDKWNRNQAIEEHYKDWLDSVLTRGWREVKEAEEA